MSDSTEKLLPMDRVMEIFGQCSRELTAVPRVEDLVIMMRRGDVGDDAISWGSVAWSLLDSSEDARVLYLVHAALSDDVVTKSVAPYPVDLAPRVVAVVKRLAPRMRGPEALADRLMHEELARQVARALDLEIAGERDATTRYLYENLDSVTKQMEQAKADFDTALANAKAAIDTRHRPSRPYGE